MLGKILWAVSQEVEVHFNTSFPVQYSTGEERNNTAETGVSPSAGNGRPVLTMAGWKEGIYEMKISLKAARVNAGLT